MRLAVIGTGHVGLVTCVTMASVGHDIIGTDSDSEKIAMLSRGATTFYEPGLKELLAEGLSTGRLGFSTDSAQAIAGAEVVFISVGTPPLASGEANLIAVESAARTIAQQATGRCVIAEKSTVPTGTAQRIRRTLARERPEIAGELDVVSNPEFLREGTAVRDALEPDRIVVGAQTEWAMDVMRSVYRPFIERGSELIETDIATAELAKHASNAFLALKISFANAIARISELSGADVEMVTRVMGKDPRIGPDFLQAGLGYGGSCFPKDLRAFRRLAEELGYDFPLLAEIERINEEAVERAAGKVRDALWNLEDKTVTILGLSFKPDTDDTRFSPGMALAQRLLEEGADVVGFDPVAGATAKAELPDLRVVEDPYEACTGAHCAVVATAWDLIRELDLSEIKDRMTYPIIVDGRNVFDPHRMKALGFTYYPTGGPPVISETADSPTPKQPSSHRS